jgi:hypothetical protein
MNKVPRPRRLARLAGCAVLILGLSLGLAGMAAPAQARGVVIPIVSHVVASWGQLGNGATSYSPVSSPVKIAGLSQVTGISAGWDSSSPP